MCIYVFKIKKIETEIMKKNNQILVKTPGAYVNMVPSYSKITSVSPHRLFNGDRRSASSGTVRLEHTVLLRLHRRTVGGA